MSLPLLQTALLLPFEHMLNTLVNADAAGPGRLASMEGSTLDIQAQDPEFRLFVKVRNNRLHLSTVFEGSANTTLQGPASGLLKVMLARDKPHSLKPYGLTLLGDTGFMQQLQTLFYDLEIDWEYHLSRIFGDLPVQALKEGLTESHKLATRTGRRFREDLGEFLSEESGLLPSRHEIELFYSGVTDLVLRLDRLQAGISHYQDS